MESHGAEYVDDQGGQGGQGGDAMGGGGGGAPMGGGPTDFGEDIDSLGGPRS